MLKGNRRIFFSIKGFTLIKRILYNQIVKIRLVKGEKQEKIVLETFKRLFERNFFSYFTSYYIRSNNKKF